MTLTLFVSIVVIYLFFCISLSIHHLSIFQFAFASSDAAAVSLLLQAAFDPRVPLELIADLDSIIFTLLRDYPISCQALPETLETLHARTFHHQPLQRARVVQNLYRGAPTRGNSAVWTYKDESGEHSGPMEDKSGRLVSSSTYPLPGLGSKRLLNEAKDRISSSEMMQALLDMIWSKQQSSTARSGLHGIE